MARKENPIPEGNPALLPVGARLRRARQERALTLADLAARTGYSKPYLSAVENGTSRPTAALTAAYAAALGIPSSEVAGPAGFATPRTTGAVSITTPTLDAEIDRVAAECGLPPADAALVRELLIDDARDKAATLRAALDWWREPGPVPVCCIPVAGWQWQEWPFAEIVAALDRAAAEAMRARIRELVIVLPPGKAPEVERAFRRSPFAERLQRVACVEQPAPLGLGHAILQARSVIGARPFAVLLPDNQFDRLGAAPTVLRQLVDQYAADGDHLVAVAKLKSQRREYGIARLEPGNGRRGQRGVSLLAEKPSGEHPVFRRDAAHDSGSVYAVVGRYVLSPSVMEALVQLGRELPPASRLELLDALQWLMERRHERVAAYVLPSVVQLEPDQTIFVAGTPAAPTGSRVA